MKKYSAVIRYRFKEIQPWKLFRLVIKNTPFRASPCSTLRLNGLSSLIWYSHIYLACTNTYLYDSSLAGQTEIKGRVTSSILVNQFTSSLYAFDLKIARYSRISSIFRSFLNSFLYLLVQDNSMFEHNRAIKLLSSSNIKQGSHRCFYFISVN